MTTKGNPSSITQDPILTGDSEAGRFLADIEEKLAALRDLGARVALALAQFRAQMQMLAQDSQITDAVRRQAMEQTRRDALTDLDQLLAGAQGVQQGAYHMIEEAAGRDVPSPGSGSSILLDEARDRAWAPIRARLEGMSDPAAIRQAVETVANEAARAGDMATLFALHDLLPIYLAERGWPNAGAEVNARLDEIEAPYLDPQRRAANLARAALEAGWPRIEAAFAQARAEMSGQGPAADAIPGFGPNEQIPIQ